MKHKHLFLLFFLGLLIVYGCEAGERSNAEESEDNDSDKGMTETEKQSAEEPPETDGNIIATPVALVEIMDQLELDLVGIPTSYKNLPKRYSDATEVGMAMDPDMEIVKSLQPTDVLSVTTLDRKSVL